MFKKLKYWITILFILMKRKKKVYKIKMTIDNYQQEVNDRTKKKANTRNQHT